MRALYIRFVLFLIGPAIRRERELCDEEKRKALADQSSKADLGSPFMRSADGRMVLLRNGQVRVLAAGEASG